LIFVLLLSYSLVNFMTGLHNINLAYNMKKMELEFNTDEFIVKAGKHGLLFEKMDENGWPIDKRVGRYCPTILQIIELWSEEHQEKALIIKNIPRYPEIIDKGTGAFLHNPAFAASNRIKYE